MYKNRRGELTCPTIDSRTRKEEMAEKEEKEVTVQLSKMELEEKECVICLEQVQALTPTVLGCCKQPSHVQCVNQWKQERATFACPYCRQAIPTVALEVPYPDFWKQDKKFMELIKKEWKDNPVWYGARYIFNGLEYEWRVGFWAMRSHPYASESEKYAVFYLGEHRGQVIPRMKTLKSFVP